jgi:hypothetical protein
LIFFKGYSGHPSSKIKCIAFVIILTAIIGGGYIGYSWTTEYNEAMENSVTVAQLAKAIMIDEGEGKSSDLQNHNYQQIQDKLIRVARADREIQFVYISIIRDGMFICVASSGPSGLR